MSVDTIFIICWIIFKCLCLIFLKPGFLQTYSSRWIFWYKQLYVFSITPKTSTIPLDGVVVSHDLVRRIFTIFLFTLIGWFWWHIGFCMIRESYRRPISPRRSLSPWYWRVWTESGDLWRTFPSCPLWHESASCPLDRGPGPVLLVKRGLVVSSSELTSWIGLFRFIIFMSISLSSLWTSDVSSERLMALQMLNLTF